MKLNRRLFSIKTRNNTIIVFGSNTDVGKTLISTGILKYTNTSRQRFYIKPVQTGLLKDADFVFKYAPEQLTTQTLHHWKLPVSPHIAAKYDKYTTNGTTSTTSSICTDKQLRDQIQYEINKYIKKDSSKSLLKDTIILVETAGGPLSPGPSSTLQADIYHSLRYPIVLVGDMKLGGISSTLAAYESLYTRGYDILAIVMINNNNNNNENQDNHSHFLGNAEFIQNYLISKCKSTYTSPNIDNMHPLVFTLTSVPTDHSIPLHNWYQENQNTFQNITDFIDERIEQYKTRLQTMQSNGADHIWWPFTQHQNVHTKDITLIESAYQDEFKTISNIEGHLTVNSDSRNNSSKEDEVYINGLQIKNMFDACASWWTQGIGHGNIAMAHKLARTASQYGHVMFPSNLHLPAADLSNYLIQYGPGKDWGNRVFYSDDGSTAMEIAMKMALRLAETRANQTSISPSDRTSSKNEVVVLSQSDCYHGDTLGTMNLTSPCFYNQSQHPWYESRCIEVFIPRVFYKQGKLLIDTSALHKHETVAITQKEYGFDNLNDVLDISTRLSTSLANVYTSYIHQVFDHCIASKKDIGALVLEPIFIGAGGFKMVDPLFQHLLVKLCKVNAIPVVFDEVAVGMYRLGPISTCSFLQITPDIASYGKLLTGGYLPLAVTIATEECYNAFLSDEKHQALLHGHSYTANPISCAAALEAIRQYQLVDGFQQQQHHSETSSCYMGGAMRSHFTEHHAKQLSTLPSVSSSICLGSILTVDLNRNVECTNEVIRLLRNQGVYARPLGSTVYIMASQITSPDDIDSLFENLIIALGK